MEQIGDGMYYEAEVCDPGQWFSYDMVLSIQRISLGGYCCHHTVLFSSCGISLLKCNLDARSISGIALCSSPGLCHLILLLAAWYSLRLNGESER